WSTSANDRAAASATALTCDADIERADDEQYRAHSRRARQHGGAAPCAERSLAGAAAERVCHAAAFPLLEEHHQDQRQTDQDVDSNRSVIQHLFFKNRKPSLYRRHGV